MPTETDFEYLTKKIFTRKEIWVTPEIPATWSMAGIGGNFVVRKDNVPVYLEATVSFAKGNSNPDFLQNNLFALSYDGTIILDTIERLPAVLDLKLIDKPAGRGTIKTVVELDQGTYNVQLCVIAQGGFTQYIMYDAEIVVREAVSEDDDVL